MSFEAENLEALEAYFKCGASEGHNLGVELEHFVVQRDLHEAIPYKGEDGQFGVFDVLEYLAQYYPKKQYGADGDLIGLGSVDGTVTLEPASQLEISISPQENVADIERIYDEFRSYVDPFLASHNAQLVTAGYHPHNKALDMPLIPKRRYHIMNDFFSSIGTHGERMMRATASTQVSVDYKDEADAVRKMRIAQALSPVLASLTDNTRVFEGETTDKPLERFAVWRDVDPARCGSVPGIFKDGWGFADYAQWLMRISPIFINRPRADSPNGESMRTFYDTPSLEAYNDALMSTSDIEHLISMVWPDVRLKHFVEIRPADSLPKEKMLAYAALVKGLFYSRESLEALEDAFGVQNGVWPLDDGSTDAALEAIRKDGKAAYLYGKTLADWEIFVVELARKALGSLSESMVNEGAYLDAFIPAH